MTQMPLALDTDPSVALLASLLVYTRRGGEVAYYRANRARRRAQRLASKWGGHFRDYLRGCV
jgi:hypothetical protein